MLVKEPTETDTISILRGLKSRFEAHHGVSISDPAIIAAAMLSNRYISDRFLPDKAIDLIDEACASIRMEIDSMPVELDTIIRKLTQLEIERQALKKETDVLSKERLSAIEVDINTLKQEEKTLKSQWHTEKTMLQDIKNKKNQLETYKNDLQTAFNDSNYQKAAELQYKTIPDIEKDIEALTIQASKEGQLLSEVVTESSIADIVSKWTHIPVTKLMSGDKEKLIHLKETLQQRVIGQDHAISLVSDAIIRQRAGIKDQQKPIGSFLFLGPTGVGKTEVARALSDALFDSEKHMVRFDMSEYMEPHSVSKLIGSPPGYVGYDEGGQLTEAVRRQPYSLLLFDEIEKAHHDVFNILLQLLDDGRLTDNQGRTVDFKNTIIIMTSNIGSEHLLSKDEDAATKVTDLVKKTFKPEFLNRLDELIIFNPLNIKIQMQIAQKMLDELHTRLLKEHIDVTFNPEVTKYVIKHGYQEEYGARPLKRFIQRHIETMIATHIINNILIPHTPSEMILENDQLVIRIKKEAQS